ncbi:hypothetical protein AHAS_Ahas15G0298200 [Arachis hypogaea]
MPLKFWDEAFLAATHIINQLPSPSTYHKLPYELMIKQISDYTVLKTFGCTCYLQLRPYQYQKFNFKTSKCLFFGYSSHHKCYKCLTQDEKILISCHVIFDETEFPYLSLFTTIHKTSSSIPY